MKAVRTVVFWCHLTVGVLVASVVILMSATGVLLTYQKQMTHWADTRGLAGGPPSATAPRLSMDSLVSRVRSATNASPTAITVRAATDAPVEVALGREHRVFINAYTGDILGEGSTRVRAFFRVVTAWHRTIGATGEQRALGRSITGFANLGFLFIVCSGLFLWWPRTWTRARLRNIAMFRRNALGKARDFNWHNTLGVWSFLPLIAIVGSGVVMSYPWANALVYRVMGEQPPAPRGATQQRAGTSPRADRGSVDRAANSAPTHPSTLSLDSAISLGASRSSDWRTITIQLPSATATTVTASVDAGTGGQPQLRGSLVLDRATAEVVRWEPFSSQTPGRRLRSLLRFAHTGEVLGVAGQTIAGLVSLGAVVLGWTGVALALRRLWSWRRRRSRVTIRGGMRREPELETAA